MRKTRVHTLRPVHLIIALTAGARAFQLPCPPLPSRITRSVVVAASRSGLLTCAEPPPERDASGASSFSEYLLPYALGGVLAFALASAGFAYLVLQG